MTQESPPSRSRNSTARTSAARSPQNERSMARFSEPGLSVATRKIAARVSGAATACARAGNLTSASGVLIALGWDRSPSSIVLGDVRDFAYEMLRSPSVSKSACKLIIGCETCKRLLA